MFGNLWRKFGDRSKVEPEILPIQAPAADYESIFFALLDEVTRRPEFSRGWIRGFLQQWNVTREELADWLREFGERLQGGEENRELQERLLRLGRLQEGELCRVAELIGQRLERENLQAPNDEAEAWLERGNECSFAGRFEQAITSYDEALQCEPNFYQAWHNRGNALAALERYEEAITSYDKAIELKPDEYLPWNNLGTLLHHLERYEEAITSYDKAIELKPDEYLPWHNRGLSLDNLERYEEAITSYNKAIELKPDEYLPWHNRGLSLDNLERYEEAIASYNKAINIKPDKHEAWCGRATSYCHLTRERNLQRSLIVAIQNSNQLVHDHISALQEAIPHLSPKTYDYAVLFSSLGRAYYDHSDSQKDPSLYWRNAAHSYTTALQIFTVDLYPKERLGALQGILFPLSRLGKIEASQTYCREGLEILRQLLNAQPTPFQKRKLETEFSGFSRVTVDSLIAQDENTLALETAERYKNRCLSWILDEWKETVISPSYAEMRQLLNPQTAIVYWHFSDDCLTTFILTPDAEDPILLNTLHYDRAQKLQSWIKTWNTQYNDYRTKKNNQSDHPWRKTLTTQLAKLREILGIDAIVQSLGTLDRLILIPHRDLHRLPLHSLFPNFTTVYLPSIQIGLNLQRKPRSTHPPKLLSVEDPKTDRPQMPYAQLESALTCHFFPNHTQLDDTNATAEKVTQALSDRHTHFHFTGHAGYDTPPENSALILANDDRLTAKTIRHLDLSHYELIILSACETALTGNQTIDTEFVGLVSAFLQAGATAVLSTLWNVDEISSTWLILKFYELQTPPTEALKTAQLWLQSLTYETLLEWLDRILAQLPSSHPYRQDIQDEITLIQKNLTEHKIELHQTPYSDPYHWAAFTLTGGTL